MNCKVKSCFILGSVFVSSLCYSGIAIAQISSDGTLSTTVSTDDAVNFLIEGGDRLGDNLFHSFSEFSIPNLGSAYFNNDVDIVNIFSRVTGGNVSDLQGLIRANGTANLFLINPAGIVFGENASLDVGGSFFATTAESVVFSDGIEFSATKPEEAPLLTINITPGLQMGSNSGNVQVNSTGHNLSVPTRQPLIRNDTSPGLQVSASNTLALVGGNITIDGGILTAENGRVEIGAVSDSNLVQLNPTELGFSLNYSEVSQFGDIQLTQQALVEASEIGAIRVRGNNISVEDGSLFLLENFSNQAAQGIEIQATDTIEFIGINSDNSLSSGVISDTLASGAGGDISLTGLQLRGNNSGGGLRAFTFGDGDSGNITLNADEIELIGGEQINSITEIRTLGRGNGGNLTVNTQSLTLQEASLISNVNNGSGSAGDILINASDFVEVGSNPNSSELSIFTTSLIASSSVSAAGNAGNVTINTPQLTLEDGALISSSTFGAGDAGTITINARERITVSGFGRNTVTNLNEPTTIRTAGVLLPMGFRQSLGLPDNVTGNAGAIILNTALLQVTDTATITVQHDDLGNAGTLQVNAGQILLAGEGNLRASTQSDDGGDITLQVQESVQLSNGSFIDTEAFGEGNGGVISIASNTLNLAGNSNINASTIAGRGGDITLEIREQLQLNNQGEILAEAQEAGQGGNVAIAASEIILSQDSNISNNVQGTATGGELTITGDSLSISSGSSLSAVTTGSGNAGNIFIEVGDIELSGIENTEIDNVGLTPTPSLITTGTLPGSSGKAGNVTVTGEQIRINNGGLIAAGTLGSGGSGNVEILATESVEITGIGNLPAPLFGYTTTNHPSRISASSFTEASAGSVDIQTPQLSIANGGVVEVNGVGVGGAGNLTIISETISLDNQASLQAQVAGGNKGNIDLTTELLLLRSRSSITTNAIGTATGGNLTIDTVNLVNLENSNISANAVFGKGGNISISAQGIFLSPDSPISASSEFGLDGVVEINTPETDSKLGVTQLPIEMVDSSEQIAQGCAWILNSSFYIIGRGGTVQDPTSISRDDQPLADSRDLSPWQGQETTTIPPNSSPTSNQTIVEANGWIINENGNVELVAIIDHSKQQTSPPNSCAVHTES